MAMPPPGLRPNPPPPMAIRSRLSLPKSTAGLWNGAGLMRSSFMLKLFPPPPPPPPPPLPPEPSVPPLPGALLSMPLLGMPTLVFPPPNEDDPLLPPSRNGTLGSPPGFRELLRDLFEPDPPLPPLPPDEPPMAAIMWTIISLIIRLLGAVPSP